MASIFYLLKLEWLKVKNYMPFIVLMGMYLILLPSLMLVGKSISFGEKDVFNINSYYMFPNVWQTLGYVGNWLSYFILGFISVLTVTNEFSNRTLRQNIISGVSRTDFFLSKLYFIIAISGVITLYYILIALGYGIVYTETVYMSKVMDNIDMVPRFFLMCLSFMSLGLLLGVTLRKTGIALFLYFAYIMFIERIIRFLIIGKIFGQDVTLYAPMSATNDLTPVPIPKVVEGLTSTAKVRMFLDPSEAIVVASVFLCIFFYLAYWQLKKRDL